VGHPRDAGSAVVAGSLRANRAKLLKWPSYRAQRRSRIGATVEWRLGPRKSHLPLTPSFVQNPLSIA
jgi:hypothetical protein